ncbi:hypothetical protein VA208B3_13280 [Vibrio alginolyticus]|nr:hypothetical protein VA208B3_13280 [Vibrio alginolyticus]
MNKNKRENTDRASKHAKHFALNIKKMLDINILKALREIILPTWFSLNIKIKQYYNLVVMRTLFVLNYKNKDNYKYTKA